MQTGKFTYVGVLEFVAEEGTCVIPDWIFENMNFFPACIVQISLERHLPSVILLLMYNRES